jgi:hypothetical protein
MCRTRRAYHHRLSGIGWTPTRSTLLNILVAAEFARHPLVVGCRQLPVQDSVAGCRYTTVGSYREGTFWFDSPHVGISGGVVTVPINVFDLTVSREGDGPDELLSEFRGFLMANYCSGFQQIHRPSGTHHARRKVHECRSSHPQLYHRRPHSD